MTVLTKRLIERFEEAVREHAFKGAQHPEDAIQIEKDYELAKALILAAIPKRKPRPKR